MSSDRISEIRARLEKATPGPWYAKPCYGGSYRDDLGRAQAGFWIPLLESLGDGECSAMLEGDAAFVAHAPADIAHLLAEVERLTSERDALRSWQAGTTHYIGCWHEHRQCAMTTIDFESARRERAELALQGMADRVSRLEDERDDKDEALVSIWSVAGAPEGLSPLQAVEKLCVERDEVKRTLAQTIEVTRLIGQVAQSASQLERERNAAYAELDTAVARAEAAEAALSMAERNSRVLLCLDGTAETRGLAMCGICDQSGLTDAIDHAPDCPFATLAAHSAAPDGGDGQAVACATETAGSHPAREGLNDG